MSSFVDSLPKVTNREPAYLEALSNAESGQANAADIGAIKDYVDTLKAVGNDLSGQDNGFMHLTKVESIHYLSSAFAAILDAHDCEPDAIAETYKTDGSKLIESLGENVGDLVKVLTKLSDKSPLEAMCYGLVA